MLSENIAALRQHFLKHVDYGVALEPTAAKWIADLLLTMTLDAAALEQSLISPVAMAPDSLPENVVRIEWPKSGTPGGVT
jgi:hypothetical protein